MIKIENVEIAGFNPAMRGMRNPKDSWERSDSHHCRVNCEECVMHTPPEDELDQWGTCALDMDDVFWDPYVIGPDDHDLAMRLAGGGPVHAKYRRMIVVWADITAPLYWWKEFDTYKVGTVCNSCSTMHRIHAKEFVRDDFSHEHLFTYDELFTAANPNDIPMFTVKSTDRVRFTPEGGLDLTIGMLNVCREKFLKVSEALKQDMDMEARKKLVAYRKRIWWQMIQLLPSSYNQRRTVMFSYETLTGTDTWRSDHKQDEWREFTRWARTLPYSEFFTAKKSEGEEHA